MSEVALTDTAVADRRDSLIKPSTKREEVMSQIYRMKSERLTGAQQEELNKYRERFINYFIKVSWNKFGLSKQQINDFQDDDLKELADVLAEKTKFMSRMQIPINILLVCSILGVGLFICMYDGNDNPMSRGYYTSYKFLKKNLGDNWLPVEELRKALKS